MEGAPRWLAFSFGRYGIGDGGGFICSARPNDAYKRDERIFTSQRGIEHETKKFLSRK
jgi:hypothetical protein